MVRLLAPLLARFFSFAVCVRSASTSRVHPGRVLEREGGRDAHYHPPCCQSSLLHAQDEGLLQFSHGRRRQSGRRDIVEQATLRRLCFRSAVLAAVSQLAITISLSCILPGGFFRVFSALVPLPPPFPASAASRYYHLYFKDSAAFFLGEAYAQSKPARAGGRRERCDDWMEAVWEWGRGRGEGRQCFSVVSLCCRLNFRQY